MGRTGKTQTVGVALGLLGCLWGGPAGCKGDADATKTDDGTIVSPYLAIGSTLADDRIDGLPELAAQVVKAAAGHESEPGVEAIVQGAGRVGATDIATARQAFKKMSDGMIQYLHAEPEMQRGRQIVHCTMTFQGKGGLWVQPEGKVLNPYEGAMMLHCGDVLAWTDPLPET